jgi:hypothetical protein
MTLSSVFALGSTTASAAPDGPTLVASEDPDAAGAFLIGEASASVKNADGTYTTTLASGDGAITVGSLYPVVV